MILLARVGRLFGSAGEQATSQILGNSVSLVGSVAMTSGVGFVYWFVAALLFRRPRSASPRRSISAMTLLAALGTFGLGTLLIAEIPRHAGREVGLIATAMVFSGCAGVALGVVFAVGVAEVNPEFRPLAASPWIVSLFSLGVGLTAAAAVLDVALLALLRSDLQFARAAVFALVKLGLIVAAGIALVDFGTTRHDHRDLDRRPASVSGHAGRLRHAQGPRASDQTSRVRGTAEPAR